ncbi:MAG: hypothetical protein JST42_28010 [Bacteroidetes bacterium]|nr:hypothetical protein [Bacteroidota bacterium]
MMGGLASIGISACKKHSPKQSNPCRIVAILDTIIRKGAELTTIETFSYDSAGRRLKYQETDSTGGRTITYTYMGNLIISRPGAPGREFTDSVYVNDKGLPYRLIDDIPGQLNDNRTFTYDDSGQLLSEIFAENNGSFHVYSIDFEYAGGDLMRETLGVNVTNYSYYTDRPAADGDYTRISELRAYGIVLRRSKHLVKSDWSANFREDFTYTFDQSGKITSCTRVTEDFTEKLVYQYDCSQ